MIPRAFRVMLSQTYYYYNASGTWLNVTLAYKQFRQVYWV